jgi:hypothetical protein
MPFEDAVAELHDRLFLREFTFSTATFVPPGGTEVELADGIVSLGPELVVLQIKERRAEGLPTPSGERKWFQRKVLREGSRQIRDTLNYLQTLKSVSVTNRRGIPIEVSLASTRRVHSVIAYRATKLLPNDARVRFRLSQSSGFIHVFDSVDYVNVARLLVTPREFLDYLAFRQSLLEKWGESLQIEEPALLGQYLAGDESSAPNPSFAWFVHTLDVDLADWYVNSLMRVFGDRIIPGNQSPTDYYHVIRELALLTRDELKPFRERLLLAIEKARAGQSVQPYRFAIPRTECGFVFMPLLQAQIPNAQDMLLAITLAHKYDLKLQKCVGLAVWRHGDSEYDILWSYVDALWSYDETLDVFVRESGLLSKVRTANVPRYTFRSLRT